MNALVMGMNHGMDTKDNITKKKSALMDYLIMHIKVRINSDNSSNKATFGSADKMSKKNSNMRKERKEETEIEITKTIRFYI